LDFLDFWEVPMKRTLTGLARALPVALLLGTATGPALPADNPPATASADHAVEIYKQGNRYVAVVPRSDGGTSIAIIDVPTVKSAGDGAAGPNMDDMLKHGNVIYSVRLSPGQTPDAVASHLQQTTPTGTKQPYRAKGAFTLTRKHRLAFAKAIQKAAQVAATVGKAIGSGSAEGSGEVAVPDRPKSGGAASANAGATVAR
jgi:hypothetical protein